MAKASNINKVTPGRVKEVRQAKNLTQPQLAEKINCVASMISMIEGGKRGLKYDDACRIAEVCDCRVEYLLGLDQYKTQDDYFHAFQNALYSVDGVGLDALIAYVSVRTGISFASNEGEYWLSYNHSDYHVTGEEMNALKQEIIDFAAFKLNQLAARKMDEAYLDFIKYDRPGKGELT